MGAGFKCLNCLDEQGMPGKVVPGDIPLCACGVDGRLPEYKNYIFARVSTHFDAPHDVLRGRGCGKRACDDKSTTGENVSSSGHTAAVTCEQCMKTDSYKKWAAIQGTPTIPEEHDMAL